MKRQSSTQQRLNIIVNIIIPMLILTKLSGPEHLGTTWWLIVALAFPIGYGLYERFTDHERNFVSWLGVFSVLMTWWIALLELPSERIAIKEAMVPAILWTVLLWSLWRWNTLIKKMFWSVLHTERILSRLGTQGKQIWEAWLRQVTLRVVASFVLSAVLNYLLARYIVVSPAGTEAFNQEIGRMTWLSFPVIALPATILMTIWLFLFLTKIHKKTGLEYEEMILQ